MGLDRYRESNHLTLTTLRSREEKMIYRNYGRSGLKVSRLGYGSMRLPRDEEKINLDEAVKVLRHAYDRGINFFDTAHLYIGSEQMIGEALADVRDNIVIQTKCPYDRPETKGNTYMDQLKRALKELKTDHVDVLLAHNIQMAPWAEAGARYMEFAKTARREGLARHLGFSSHADVNFVIRMIDTGEFDAMLVPYNLVETRYTPAIHHAKESGMGVSVMNPVGGGRLGPPNPEIQKLIGRPVYSTVEMALRFALDNADIDVVLSGMTRPEWVDQNAAITESERYLSEADKEHIEKMVAEKQKLADLYCTGCGYCLPCPQGVSIPFNFLMMNMYRLYGLEEWAKTTYKQLKPTKENDGDMVRASGCIRCGKCEPKCPNKIKIMDQLAEVARVLGEEE
jgi:hypothetical protein